MDPKDVTAVVALAIAIAAFALNLLILRNSRRRDQCDLFLKIHERLIDPDIQQGRRLLHGRLVRLRMPLSSDATAPTSTG